MYVKIIFAAGNSNLNEERFSILILLSKVTAVIICDQHKNFISL